MKFGKIVKVFGLGVFFLGLAAGTSSAFTCSAMKITYVGGTDYVSSGAAIWAQNVSGAACNALANNAVQKFIIADTANADKKLAIVLTAVSLGKNVYINATGDGSTGTGAIDVVSMSN
ncbi:MAG: hypothetical protein ACYCYR_01595 [Desulfobulbaceae bacterium]|jgi:phosphotransferase system HPr-like phosphotransfer protein